MRRDGFRISAATGGTYRELTEAPLLPEESSEKEFALPDGTENLRLEFPEDELLVNLRSVRGYCGFWYDLALITDGFRLGHSLYLLTGENRTLTAEEFRFGTTKIKIDCEVTPVSEEMAKKLTHDLTRLFDDRDELTRKWKYQTQVYDEKVKDVVRLEGDKVALNETIDELRSEVEFWRTRYHEMEGSLSWRLTALIRSANASVKKFRRQSEWKARIEDYRAKITAGEAKEENDLTFSLLVDEPELSEEELFRIATELLNQTTRNYELIVYDTTRLAERLSAVDARIRLVKKELGLAGLIHASTGAYLGFFDTGDILTENTLTDCAKRLSETEADLIYTDSDFYTEELRDANDPWYKPDFSPDYLRSMNYIRGFFAARRELFEKVDFKRDELGGAKHYGLLLRLTEFSDSATGGRGITHLAEKCYFERKIDRPGVLVSEENDAAIRALNQHLSRCGLSGSAELLDKQRGLYRIRYELTACPLISILIPNKDHADDLRRCVDSILRLSTYRNFEIVVIENNSAKKETFDFYEELTHGYAKRFSKIETGDGGRTLTDSTETEEISIRVLRYESGFNFSEINNFGVPETRGEYLLLLNNDTEVRTPGWMEELLMFAGRADVGAVGAKLFYADDTIQHAGVIIGLGGVAAHSHLAFPREATGYMNRLLVAQNLSAVTAACLLMRRLVYEEIGGMNPHFQVAFNDADFCMRIRSKGYLIVFTPFAELLHDESKSRGVEDTPEKAERFESEVQRFRADWTEILEHGDPYYNAHLTTREENFAVEDC